MALSFVIVLAVAVVAIPEVMSRKPAPCGYSSDCFQNEDCFTLVDAVPRRTENVKRNQNKFCFQIESKGFLTYARGSINECLKSDSCNNCCSSRVVVFKGGPDARLDGEVDGNGYCSCKFYYSNLENTL